MKLEIEVNNLTNSPLADDFFVRVAEKTINETGYDFLYSPAGGKSISISVALVSEEEMRRLNRENRKKDSVTDILSFFEYETIEEIKDAMENLPTILDEAESKLAGGIFLGELILCYDDIVRYAQSENMSLEKELANVFSHGVLHLLCFSHGEKMFSLQKKIISEI
jgi:probable rRNA maturation factor